MVTLESLNEKIAAVQAEYNRRYLATSTPTTAEEEKALLPLIADLKQLKQRKAQLFGDDDTRAAMQRDYGIDPANGQMAVRGSRKTIGQQLVGDEQIAKWLKDKGYQSSGGWKSPAIDLHATLLTEDPASGGALVTPMYLPGIFPTPMRRPTVADLLAAGSATSNAVGYMEEKTYTNAADVVAEGAAKPESAMTFAAVNEPVHKVAHWLPVTDELLEDQPALASYIDARLIQGVRVALDNELLNGSGVTPHFTGILHRAGLTPALPQGTMTAADAIATQTANIAIATEGVYLPDAIILNPADWNILRLAKTSTGEYISGGPFSTQVRPMLWDLPVVFSSGLAVGSALIGAFKTAAQLFLRGPIRTEVSNSHADYWIRNLVAIRSEVRGALAVYRPQAFGLVTGLAAPVVTP